MLSFHSIQGQVERNKEEEEDKLITLSMESTLTPAEKSQEIQMPIIRA